MIDGKDVKRPLALVLPGGGFRGAYQAGAVMELAAQNISFDVVAGASVGACNGAALVLGIADELTEYWEKAVTRGIFQPKQLLRGKNPFKIAHVLDSFAEDRSGNEIDPSELEVDLLMSVTKLETLSNVIFSFKDPDWEREEKRAQYLSSSCIPFLCDPIEIRGEKYIDGGVTNNRPIQAAIEWGAKEVWVVEVGDGVFWEKIFFTAMQKSLKLWPRPSDRIRLLQAILRPEPIVEFGDIVVRSIRPSAPAKVGGLFLTRERVLHAIDLGKKDAQNFLGSV